MVGGDSVQLHWWSGDFLSQALEALGAVRKEHHPLRQLPQAQQAPSQHLPSCTASSSFTVPLPASRLPLAL